jgi:branched-subunit amino acid transport protein
MAVVTYMTRLPLWYFARHSVRVHPLLDRLLEQIPIAAFAAIVFPGVLQPDGETSLDASNLYLYAAAATVVAALVLRGRLLPTILVGVTTAVLLQLVFG